LLNREGKRQRIKATARTKATADFSTTAAKCAAFGRNDGVWFWGKRTDNDELQRRLQLQTADFSTAAANAPPSVEMTIFGLGDFAQRGRDPQL